MPTRRLPAATALRRALVAALLAALAAAAPAGAWSPAPLDQTVRAAPIAVAGDAVGDAFAVYAGAAADVPLLLAERRALDPAPGDPPLVWAAAGPMPGGIPQFTTASRSVDALAAAGGGDGAGAIAVRSREGDGNLITLLVRDAGHRFSDPQTVGDTRLGRLGPPVLGMSQAGTAILAFTARRGGAQRVAAVTRLAGNRIGRTRPISPAGAGAPAVAVGPQQLPLAAWVRGRTLEVARFGDDGRPRATVRIARTAAGATVAAAGSAAGAVVAWRGADGDVHALRRSRTGALGRAVRVAGGAGAVRGLTATMDEHGVATLAWLAGRGTSTRIAIATLRPTGAPRVITPARGAALGAPALAARPGGGAIAAWASSAGWTSARTDLKGVFGAPTPVTRTAPTWRHRPFVLAGPANRVSLVWLEPSAGTPGAMTLIESTETDA